MAFSVGGHILPDKYWLFHALYLFSAQLATFHALVWFLVMARSSSILLKLASRLDPVELNRKHSSLESLAQVLTQLRSWRFWFSCSVPVGVLVLGGWGAQIIRLATDRPERDTWLNSCDPPPSWPVALAVELFIMALNVLTFIVLPFPQASQAPSARAHTPTTRHVLSTLALPFQGIGRVLMVVDVSSDVLLALALRDAGETALAAVVLSLSALPWMLCAVSFFPLFLDRIRQHQSRYFVACIVLYWLLIWPVLGVCDVVVVIWFAVHDITNTRYLVHYERIRVVSEAFLESLPQVLLQTYIVQDGVLGLLLRCCSYASSLSPWC